MNKIVVVDYGMGNLRSVAQALRAVAPEAEVIISGEVAKVKQADRLVLPGQGAMPDCMASLRDCNLQEIVIDAARNKPLFGVCIGEQMLFDWSAEVALGIAKTAGLGLLPGSVEKFNLSGLQEDGSRFKVPQMGWNQVQQVIEHEKPHPLWLGIANFSYFYFVHSYYAKPANLSHIVGWTNYGQPFASAVAHENIFATQFHPEKSAAAGLQLYKNFSVWNP